jgi:heme/copper-type cytochrome/quinol oxidase subunit 3
MTELIPYRSLTRRSEDTASLGLLIFLASWSMLFAAGLFAYGALRLVARHWPPDGVARMPATLPALGILTLVAASAAMQLGLWRIERGRPLELSAALILALLFGLLFLGLQVVFWHRLDLAGIHWRDDPYGAVLFGMTALEALHVGLGVGAVGVLLSRSIDGRYSAPRHLPVRLWTQYWHFLGAMWLVIFGLVFFPGS